MAVLNKIVAKILDWALGFIMVSIVIILFVGVIFRYLFNTPLFWSEEVTILGLIWMTFLGGAILVREDKNVCIIVVRDIFPPQYSFYMKVLSSFLVLIILVVMIWQSYKLTGYLASNTTPALRISEACFGYALLMGFAVMLFYQIQQFLDLFRKKQLLIRKKEKKLEGRCVL